LWRHSVGALRGKTCISEIVKDSLKKESENLNRSWMRHDPAWLGEYLVAGVEDPRMNIQSVLSRHFLTRWVMRGNCEALMNQEYRFAVTMNWLSELAHRGGGAEEYEIVLHALKRSADNAEGLEIPWFLIETFRQLPTAVDGLLVPNYIEQFLSAAPKENSPATLQGAFNTFRDLWATIFSRIPGTTQLPLRNEVSSDPNLSAGVQKRSVLEPACGSANDFRFFHSYGLASWLDYSGFDLCAGNVDNARAWFPDIKFEVGNVFEIDVPDKAFDLCIVHDLFEHLSLEGLQTAIDEICRVTRLGICVGFFQMEEIRDHIVRPLDDYFCNLLSMARTRESFVARGFKAQVIHIGTFLREQVGCELSHNPNAYTFLLHAT
jgi:SAM-dependent methyltransferase